MGVVNFSKEHGKFIGWHQKLFNGEKHHPKS
jgi:hypothetical protein